MRKLLIIIITCSFVVGCGVKSDPEYKAQVNYIKKINII